MTPKPPNAAKGWLGQRPKRLRNTLVSLLICAGLMAAWYVSLSGQVIAPDTRIVYEAQDCGGACPVFRLEITADGSVSLSDATQVYTYRISAFALRRILRAFDRTQFLTRDINAYLPSRPPVCDLALSEDHRKISLRHACGADAPELADPVRELEAATRFRAVLAGHPSVLRELHVVVTRK
ncbi:DUF6438 domain-containing protein [Asticcacaulis sp. EMRT-3]|uniref:DUF6438 domain-containing protein n=1 Tax=Asticcacaulis sp. EMRT-3 TaxID=3040349 RepID=UPI0024AF7DDF|nr:DUF6438 domain-containing protein [Asticcacaulis sp. EMRT-3]MDI7774506.1 DUF6438 domain-containing protein [Asticcacaulis sp. EMRT-3]